jgi:hypothetical protein
MDKDFCWRSSSPRTKREHIIFHNCSTSLIFWPQRLKHTQVAPTKPNHQSGAHYFGAFLVFLTSPS